MSPTDHGQTVLASADIYIFITVYIDWQLLTVADNIYALGHAVLTSMAFDIAAQPVDCWLGVGMLSFFV